MKKGRLILVASLLLVACDKPQQASAQTPASDNAETRSLINDVKKNLVFVQGGEFLMGDFGRKYGAEKMHYDANDDSEPLHKVNLTSYSIGKFKTTNQEYQYYLKLNGLALKKASSSLTQELMDSLDKLPNTPAHMDWDDATKYCAWLKTVSGLPFALPTEAQWEYAARSRGQYLAVGTNSGVLEMNGIQRGINISGSRDREEFAQKMGLKSEYFSTMPVDQYPPNPLGLYDMAGNGFEWVHDWYDPDYYSQSPVNDPQGPEKPSFKDYYGHYTKVLRGVDYSGPMKGATVSRYQSPPDTRVLADKTVRCVVNRPAPVK